ncbi:hypothetical protein MPSEU_000159600 [Mayamaea pseudoterrestris]|nr:hypothetical protein MPSEU_000159600 [Mayamaea pseudoterrestris]
MVSSCPLMEVLNDETLGKICSHLDFMSAHRFKGSSKRLGCALDGQLDVWKELHQRLGFANDVGIASEKYEDGNNVLLQQETVERYKCSQALHRLANPSCIPTSAWTFLPFEKDSSTGPSSVLCESYVSLVGGSSHKVLVADPWTRQLTLRSVLHEAVITNETADEPTLLGKRSADAMGGRETLAASFEVLLAPSFESLNLLDCFPPSEHPNLEAAVAGFECFVHPRLSNGLVPGSDIYYARDVELIDSDTPVYVVELYCWFLEHDSKLTSDWRIHCFFDLKPHCLRICAARQVMFSNAFDSTVDQLTGAPIIKIYSMQPMEKGIPNCVTLSNTAPNGQLNIGERIITINICPTNNRLIVVTTQHKIQIWNCHNLRQAYIEELLDVPALLKDLDELHSIMLLLFEQIRPTPLDESIVAQHLPIHVGGFVTVHYLHGTRCFMLVWKRLYTTDASKGESKLSYQIVSLIELPISPGRRPCIRFDGRRLVVFANDQIGHLVLVYQVRLSEEDAHMFSTLNHVPGKEIDGSVVNFGPIPHVRYVNRIRHADLNVLGPLENYHMALNDRFLVFSARRNSEASTSISDEGVLVLDLKAITQEASTARN